MCYFLNRDDGVRRILFTALSSLNEA